MMLTGYFDGSGNARDTSAFVVGGYISTVKQWEKFSTDWQSCLDKFGVDCFHMREFAHSIGRFKAWKGEQAKRTSFLKQLVATIKRRAQVSFCSGVISEDYNAVNAEFPLRETLGAPYPLCAEVCIAFIEQWLMGTEDQHTFPEMFFESGDEGKGELMQVFEAAGLDPPIFRQKSKINPLQAADLVAWENLKAYANILEHQNFKVRKSLRALARTTHYWKIFDMNGLMGLVDDHRLPQRSRMPPGFLESFRAERTKTIKAPRSVERHPSPLWRLPSPR